MAYKDPNYQKKYNIKNRAKLLKKSKDYYKNNIEKFKERAKKWRNENKDKLKIIKKRYYVKHRSEIFNKKKIYNKKNKEKIAKNKKEYAIRNQAKIKKYKKEYQHKNKEKIAKSKKEYSIKNHDKLKAYKHEHYVLNRDKYIQRSRKYVQDNLDRVRKTRKKYSIKNAKKIKDKSKNYYKKNKHKIIKYQKEHRAKNKEKLKVRQQKYYHKNKDKIRSYKSNWSKQMYKDDLDYRLRAILRRRFKLAIKNNNKSSKSIKLLGCSIEKFKKYFESKFTNGMNWGKYKNGGIHIDHIIPCSIFDLSKPEAQKICFHYKNLQPLWEVDNRNKGNKIDINTFKKTGIKLSVLKKGIKDKYKKIIEDLIINKKKAKNKKK